MEKESIIFILSIVIILLVSSSLAAEGDKLLEIKENKNSEDKFQVEVILNDTKNVELDIESQNLELESKVSSNTRGGFVKEDDNYRFLGSGSGEGAAYLINVTVVEAEVDGKVDVELGEINSESVHQKEEYLYETPEAALNETKENYNNITGNISEENKKEAKNILMKLIDLMIRIIKLIADIISDLISF